MKKKKKKNYCKRDVISSTYCFKKDIVGKEYRKNENGLICKDSMTVGETISEVYQWYLIMKNIMNFDNTLMSCLKSYMFKEEWFFVSL